MSPLSAGRAQRRNPDYPSIDLASTREVAVSDRPDSSFHWLNASWTAAIAFFEVADFSMTPARTNAALTSRDRMKEVLADEAQEILAGGGAEARAMFGEFGEQADMIRGRPVADPFADAAVFFRFRREIAGVFRNGRKLGAVADDALVGEQAGDVVVAGKAPAAEVETFEGFLEARPLRLDHLPVEARLEDTARRHRQVAVVGHLGELRLRLGARLVQHPWRIRGLAVALFGQFADLRKFLHARPPFVC